LDKNNDAYHISLHTSLKEDLHLNPDDFLKGIQNSVEMNFRDLMALVRKVEAEGYDATTYRVDLYAKSAYPFTCIIMAIVGISLTARKKLKEGLAISITYGIGIGFLYYIFHNLCVSLGYGAVLPSLLSAWLANLIFLSGSIILLLNAE
jgi:lipopolysaccharide export system permease protein